MAYAKEIMGGGFSAGQAGALGGQANTVAATGSVIGDAAPLNSSINIVSGADGNKGVILTGGTVGDECWVFNNSASTLKVYPPSSASAIAVPGTGLGTAASAFSHLTYKTVQYKCQSSTQWFPLVTA